MPQSFFNGKVFCGIEFLAYFRYINVRNGREIPFIRYKTVSFRFRPAAGTAATRNGAARQSETAESRCHEAGEAPGVSEKEPLTKKEKQRAKNKQEFIRRMQLEQQLRQVDVGAPEFVPSAPPEKTQQQKEEEIWSAKLQQIKDRNTGRRRAAKDRWNRFAGTSGSGGRGL